MHGTKKHKIDTSFLNKGMFQTTVFSKCAIYVFPHMQRCDTGICDKWDFNVNLSPCVIIEFHDTVAINRIYRPPQIL